MKQDGTLQAAIERARVWWDEATPEQRKAMHDAQRESWIRGMAPCEHGDPDCETCPECLTRRDAHPIHSGEQ